MNHERSGKRPEFTDLVARTEDGVFVNEAHQRFDVRQSVPQQLWSV
jgi:hypothetical protein